MAKVDDTSAKLSDDVIAADELADDGLAIGDDALDNLLADMDEGSLLDDLLVV